MQSQIARLRDTLFSLFLTAREKSWLQASVKNDISLLSYNQMTLLNDGKIQSYIISFICRHSQKASFFSTIFYLLVFLLTGKQESCVKNISNPLQYANFIPQHKLPCYTLLLIKWQKDRVRMNTPVILRSLFTVNPLKKVTERAVADFHFYLIGFPVNATYR